MTLFRPCLIVPVFNPGPALERTLEALRLRQKFARASTGSTR